jgi:FMN phosphatase YigB (HAD superfamily)
MRHATLALPAEGMTAQLQTAKFCADHLRLHAGAPPWQVRALVFEAANVLYDDTAWRRWLFRLLSSLGLHTNYASFFRVWDDEYLPAVNRGEHDFEAAFRRFLSAVGLKDAQIQEVETAAYPRRVEFDGSVRLLPGVLATLRRICASGMRLAVLSDCALTAEQLRARLARLELSGLVSHCRTSLDLRATKPALACYDAILADLALLPREVAFVGHRHDCLAGAAARGMRTIAFNWDSDAHAEWHLRNFTALAEPPAAERQAA